jgi:hypothetical protein
MGWLRIIDDDVDEPHVDTFMVNGVGQDGSGRLRGGGIAIVGVNGDTVGAVDGNESFAFVVLSPFPRGTVIHFTDTGWANNSVSNQWHRSSEFHTNFWVSTGSEAVGSVVTLTLTNINNGGDQVAVYQYDGAEGTTPSNNPHLCRFLYAVNMRSAWSTPPVPDNNESSALYYGLTNGVTALDLPSAGSVNVRYTGPRTGLASWLLGQISNPTNWTADGANQNYADFGSDFTVLGPGDMEWDVPILTDAQVREGGYTVTSDVQDVDKGLLGLHDQGYAPGPYFALFNTNGMAVTSNRFAAGGVHGSTNNVELSQTAPTGIYENIVLGTYQARLVVADRDNDRLGDTMVTSNTLSIAVIDDDSDRRRKSVRRGWRSNWVA